MDLDAKVAQLTNTTSHAEGIFYPLDSSRTMSAAERKKRERRLLWKLDVRLMIPLILMYIMNYLDRCEVVWYRAGSGPDRLGVSALCEHSFRWVHPHAGAFESLSEQDRETGDLSAGLYGGMGAIQDFGGLVAVRFLLGFVEAAYFPGCMVCLTAWYTRRELALRTALLYCGSSLSGAFSGLIAAGITADLDGKLGLSAWRWLFIIEGAMTVTIALLVMFILPDFPANTRWISDQERELATWRLTEDIEGEDWTSAAEETLFTGLKQCVRDYKTWFLVVLVFGAVSSGTINSYFPTVVQTLGYGRTETLLLTAPPYLLSCIVALCVSLNADRTGERYFNFSLTLWISVAVFIISASTTSLAARYFAMMIMLPGVYTAFTIGLTWTANTLPRPPAKRAAALALCNAVGNCSSIYGSFLYPSSTAPRYGLAMGVNAGTAFLSIVTATIFRFVLIRLNGKLDDEEGTRAAAVVEERSENADMVGLAEASNFRFLY